MYLDQLSKSTYVSGWLDRARSESRSWDLPDTKHSCYPFRLWLQVQGFCLNLKSSTGTSSCLLKITCVNVCSAWCPTWRIATNLVINKSKWHQPKILWLIFYNSYFISELKKCVKLNYSLLWKRYFFFSWQHVSAPVDHHQASYRNIKI